MSKCTGQLYVHREIHESDPAKVTDGGHLKVDGKAEIIDVTKTWVTCEKHGKLATTDYAEHGISEYWEEV